MAEDQVDMTGTEENESPDEERPVTDDFRYLPLDDREYCSPNDEDSPEAGISGLQNGSAMQTSMTSRSGYNSSTGGYSSGCDSSDIEVIPESSSSIEVLDPGNLDNANYPEEKDNENYNQNVERSRVDNEGAMSEVVAEEVVVAHPQQQKYKPGDIAQAQGDSGGSLQDSQSSETVTLRSASSMCSNIDTDMPGPSHTRRMPSGNLEAEAREIFAAIDALDREHSSSSNSPVSSSLSASPFNSPSHRPLVPLEPNIVTMENGLTDRPDSLYLPRSLQYNEKRRLMKKESSASSLSEFSSRSSSMDALIEAAMSTPLQSQGVVTTEGDMVAFVASGLEHMIRMSSPMSRDTNSGNLTPRSMTSMSSSASGWSTSSASGWSYSGLSREETPNKHDKVTHASPLSELLGSPSVLTQSPDDIPPIDPRVLMDLELHARNLATSLDKMMVTLKKNLFKMSSITCDCIDAYKEGIDHTCDSVDSGIKMMYALMAKCEELSKRMGPIYKLHKEIQEVKRLLSMFESQMLRDEKKT